MARSIAILCEHGIIEHDEYGRELTGCEGGRVLDPGSYVLIERNERDSRWMVPPALPDALAGGEQP